MGGSFINSELASYRESHGLNSGSKWPVEIVSRSFDRWRLRGVIETAKIS